MLGFANSNSALTVVSNGLVGDPISLSTPTVSLVIYLRIGNAAYPYRRAFRADANLGYKV